MSSRVRAGLAGAGAAGALYVVLVPAATAAIFSDRVCYREGATATFLGIGFQPGQPVAILLDSRQLATQAADPIGRVGGRIPVLPAIPRSEMQRSLTMSQVTNPAVTATVVFRETKLYVVTKPGRFRPGRRLRMRAGGFYGGGATLYAHVRGPRRRDVRIGRVAGPCGKVSATRKVLLKRGDPAGIYRTQFDTLRRYRGLAASPLVRKTYAIRRIIRFTRAGSLSQAALGGASWAPARD